MTRDPDEGLDTDGYLTTGVALDRIPPAYVAVVADCVAEIARALGATLHGLYLYGSVATGRARRPASDLDLLAVTLSAVDVSALEADLSARHRDIVREVGISHGTLAQVWADGAEGLGGRCFLKHYCVPLTGVDLRAELPACRTSREVADGFNGDLLAACRAWRSTVDTPVTARNAARRLLRAAATLESVEHGGWSTDQGTGAELVARHHPEWTVTVRRALSWIDRPDHADPDHVRDLLAFGEWLATRPRPAITEATAAGPSASEPASPSTVGDERPTAELGHPAQGRNPPGQGDGHGVTTREARSRSPPVIIGSVTSDQPVRFDTKIAVLLRDDLPSWQALNATAFLVSGLASAQPELLGQPYADADDTAYLPMFRQPVLVLTGSRETLTAAHARALDRGIPLSIFTADLFATGNDRDNRAAVRSVPRDRLDLVGLALHGPRNAVDKVLRGARMHH